MFKKRENVVEIEEGNLLSPKFDNDGLIPVVTMCSKTKDILMHGYMNVEALKKTIETKEASFVSMVFFNASTFIYPCIKMSFVLEHIVTTGINPSLSNFGERRFPSSISTTFSLFLNIYGDYVAHIWIY